MELLLIHPIQPDDKAILRCLVDLSVPTAILICSYQNQD